MNKLMQIGHAYDAALEKYNCLVLPTVAFVSHFHSSYLFTHTNPTQVANTHPAPDATALRKVQKSVGQGLNCCPFNGTGHPALTFPIGTLPPTEEDWAAPEDAYLRLPVGMQLVGKWWDEAGLCQIAHAWEGAYDWKSR